MDTVDSRRRAEETPAVPPGPRRSGWRWRSLFWLVPLALVLFVLISELFGWAYLRTPIASYLSARMERRVDLGTPFRIHLRRSVAVRIGSIYIAAPQWSEQPHFADIDGLEADIGWGVLFGRQPLLHRLAVGRADIRAERDEQGRASWSMGAKDESDSQAPGPMLPAIEQLSIGTATIVVHDAPSDLSLELKASTAEGQTGAHAGLLVNGQGTWKGDPVSFVLRTPGVLPLASGGALTDIDLKGKLKSSELAFKGSVSDITEFRNISGSVAANGSSLGDMSTVPGLTLPSTPEYRLDGKIERAGASIKFDVTRAEIGSSRLAAQLEYDGAATPPVLRGTLDASRLVLQDLGPAIGAGGRQPANTAKSENQRKPANGGKSAKEGKSTKDSKPANDGKSSRVLPTREFNLPLLRAMNADVAVDLQKLDLGTDALRPLRSLKAKLLLEGGVLRLRDLTSSLAGGTVTGSMALDASSADRAPAFDTHLRWNRVDLKNWLTIGEGGYFVAGRFSGETNLKGAGKSTAAILDSMGGTVKGRIDGGSISHQIVELAGLDAAQALGVFVKGDEPLVLSCALVDLAADKGTIRSNLFLLNTSDTVFFVQGSVNFRDERLNLKLVQSPKDWSPLSLRSPVTIGGTFADPAVGVEPGPIAMKVLSSIVLGAVTPIAALLPLIEMEDNSAKEGCAPAIALVKRKASELQVAPATPAQADEGKPANDGTRDDKGVVRRSGSLPGGRP